VDETQFLLRVAQFAEQLPGAFQSKPRGAPGVVFDVFDGFGGCQGMPPYAACLLPIRRVAFMSVGSMSAKAAALAKQMMIRGISVPKM
jgi:hypothetical protein